MNLVSLFNIILSGTLCLKNTSFIQTCTISSAKISSVQVIKYPYLVNLFIKINILLYSYFVIGSFNFSNFTIKSYNMTSVGIHALINMHEYHCIAIRMRCWLLDDSCCSFSSTVSVIHTRLAQITCYIHVIYGINIF